MEFVQNFPFFCIILSMFSAIISFVMNGRIAKIHSRGHGYGSADTFPGNPFLCGGEPVRAIPL